MVTLAKYFPKKLDIFDDFFMPSSYLGDVFDEFHRDFFNNFFSTSIVDRKSRVAFPKIDVIDEADNLVIEASVPGFKKEDITIKFQDNVLLLRAQSQNKESKEVRNFIHKELHRSSFSRSFNIEEELYDVDKISAEINDGILTLKITKKMKEEVKPQKVINVEIN